jgi:hypothetical protein
VKGAGRSEEVSREEEVVDRQAEATRRRWRELPGAVGVGWWGVSPYKVHLLATTVVYSCRVLLFDFTYY